jgi:Xaa-Pro aminopeptidase
MSEKLKLEYFAKRRVKLLSQIEDNSIVIIPGNTELIRNGDAHYSFRQNSNFFYLTGFLEPDSLIVLIKEKEHSKFILFVRARDPASEQWDGLRAGVEGAKSLFGADLSYDIDSLDHKIIELIRNKTRIYYDLGSNIEYDCKITSWLNTVKTMQRKGVTAIDAVVSINNILSEMRLIKDEYEQYLMQKAAQISAAAHIRAMQAASKSKYEYELEADYLHECVKHGARNQAYNPIIGSGSNTCILHYNDNDQILDKEGLVLIDAGAEYFNYAADITRTFPANGKFTDEQKAIYQLVLKSQLAAIEQIKPGNTWNQAQEVILEIITSGLVELGIIKANGKSVAQLVKEEVYKPFYMHNSGHWLGIDVHDAGNYKIDGKWRVLKPGMVLTVEPGIYIKDDLPGVESKWKNIGVRIEDDILVTEHGHEVLTKDVPKQIHEIETLMLG